MTDIEPILHLLRKQIDDNTLDEEDRVVAERLVTWINCVKRDQRKALLASKRLFKHARRHKEALRLLHEKYPELIDKDSDSELTDR